MHVGILAAVQDQRKHKGDDLTGDGGDGGTRDLQPRHSAQAEDQDRIEDDVDDRAGALRDEGIDGAAGRLQQALEDDLAEDAERDDGDDADILRAVADDGGVVRLRAHERLRAEDAEQGGQHRAAQGKEEAVQCRAVDLVLIFLAQRAREQGVDTDGDAGRYTDHDVLHGEGEGDGVERVLIDVGDFGDEGAVNDVVKRLYEHGQRHRQRHGKQQPTDRTHTHFVLFQRFHSNFLILLILY